MGGPRIIPRGTRNLPLTKKQKILRAIYFTPLTFLLLERVYIPLEYADLAAYLDVERVAVTKVTKIPKRVAHSYLPLDVLTRSSQVVTIGCPQHTTAVTDVVPQNSSLEDRRIPRIVHQTARSRCVTPAFRKITSQWKFPDHAYYFHDDEAVARLFRMSFPQFPHLKTVVYYCVKNPAIKAELWKYLVLWLYGGIYADFDTAPVRFDSGTVHRTDDSFFVMEKHHTLGQWFMAASPRHPIMFYAVQMTLLDLLEEDDVTGNSRHSKSGSETLHAAFTRFRGDVDVMVDPIGEGMKPLWSGVFDGPLNRSITVVGTSDNEDEYVQRTAIDALTRKRDYIRMGMSHFSFSDLSAKKPGESCHNALLTEIMVRL